MKKVITLLLILAGGVGLLTSCQQLDDQVEPAEETYTKAFIKKFGLIDPNQDWNMATRGSVSVTTSSPVEIKVYGLIDDRYYLVGDFGNVSGTQTLNFDIPRGTTQIRVSDGSHTYGTTVGGEVNFANVSSRAASTNSNDGTTAVDEKVEALSWIIAAEDLGGTDDFDFNDMVIEVSTPTVVTSQTENGYVDFGDLGWDDDWDDDDWDDDDSRASTLKSVSRSGSTTKYVVKVTALAAGGTLPLKLCRNDEVLESPIEGLADDTKQQFHSWFGDGSVSTGTMINTTSATSYTTSTKTLTLTEDEKNAFTLSSKSVNSMEVTSKMGGFKFKVLRDGDYTTTIEAPNDGEAPQMICVPSTWLWPKERMNISTAYEGFGTWGANYGTSNGWYNTPKDGTVVTRTAK